MDVKTLPTGRTATPSTSKQQKFIIQESITFNQGQITASFTSSSKNDAKSVTSSKKLQTIMGDRNLLQDLKTSLNHKMSQAKVPLPVVEPASSQKRIVKTIQVPSTSRTLTTVKRDIVKPSSQVEYKSHVKPNVSQMNYKSFEDFEDMIPTSLLTLSKKSKNEIAISSEVSLFPAGHSKRKVDVKPNQEAVTISQTQTKPPQNIQTKKKVKKKKRRFRNMDGSEDEDDWPSVTISTLRPKVTDTPKVKEKVQVLQEYIFPSPHKQPKTPLTPKKIELVDKVDKVVSDGHMSDDSVSSIHSKMSTISDFNLNGSLSNNESTLEGNVSSISKNDAAEEETVVLKVLEGDVTAETKPGEIFCTYDDEGNLICLQKTESGELLMLPTEQVDQQDEVVTEGAIAINNNSFEMESKEEQQKVSSRLTEDKTEEDLLLSSPEQSPSRVTPAVEGDEDLLLADDAPSTNTPTVDEGKDVGILAETVENVGNEEIVAEPRTPEEEIVTLPTNTPAESQEPIYILNESEQPELADMRTPLEIAFVTTLQSFAQTAVVSPQNKRQQRKLKGQEIEAALIEEEPQSEVILTELETLLKRQDQCSIVDYVPSDESDCDLNESIESVDSLSQMDITKMVLGEGFGARLVSNQEEAVDLLQLPPGYEQKPLVAVSIAPLVEDAVSEAKPEPEPKRTIRKKTVGATSTPHYKNASKKKTIQKPMIFQHITGDSDVTSPVKLKFSKTGKVPALSPEKPVKKIKKSKQKVNGSLAQSNVSADGDTAEFADLSSSQNSLTSFEDDMSREYKLKNVRVNLNAEETDRMSQKGKKFKRKQKRKSKSDDNNSSKENNSISEMGASGSAGRLTRSLKSRTRTSLPIGLNLSNSEVEVSILTGGDKIDDDDVIFTDDTSQQEPIDVDALYDGVKDEGKSENDDGFFKTPNSFDESHTHSRKKQKRNRTPVTSDDDKMADLNELNVTPKSAKKIQFKINFKKLLNQSASPPNAKKHKHKKSSKGKDRHLATPTSDIDFDPNIKIKDEPLDDYQPKVPKIILKLSPHTSPSIVRSPSSSPKKASKLNMDALSNTPRSKGSEKKKRNMLSPLAENSPKRKKLSTSKGDSVVSDICEFESEDDAEKTQPLITDDPELVINLPQEALPSENAVPSFDDVKVKMEDDLPAHAQDTDPLFVGDLVVGRLSTFCFWPCMVTVDPEKQIYRRAGGPKKTGVSYHVRFFGDNGRRAWVHRCSICRYDGPDTLDKISALLKDKLTMKPVDIKTIRRDIAACKVANKMLKAWKVGMAEAEALVNKTVQERHEFFFNMFSVAKSKRNMKRKRQNTETDNEFEGAAIKTETEIDGVVVKDEPVDSPVRSPPAKKPKNEVRKSATPKVTKKAKKIAVYASPKVSERRQSTRSNKSTPSSTSRASVADSPKDSINLPTTSSNEQKRSYVIEDLELIIKGSLVMQDENNDLKKDDDSPKKAKSSVKNGKSADLKQSLKLKSDAASEMSDTSSSSKFSAQSAGNKRVLFKDVPRLPVCHVCFKSAGTVLKCKGTCFGFYHPTCSELKTEVKKEEEKEPKELPASSSPSTPKDTTSNVEIVSVKSKSKYFDENAVNLNDSDIVTDLDLIDQLDNKLSKVMAPIAATTNYNNSTTDDAVSEDEKPEVIEPVSEVKTADSQPAEPPPTIHDDFMCIACKHDVEPPCFSCGSTVYLQKHIDRFKCSVNGCGKYFHKECLKCWPQAIISNDEAFNFKCPMHNCQTCTSENPHACTTLLPMSKTIRCVKCPATYHVNSFCIPAGTEILSQTQIICPRHVHHKIKRYTINSNWCFICSKGGNLMCCETCPTSVHSECITINFRADDTFVCEDCESGRLPLYDEIVWAKYGHFRWWPAVILFPEDIPENVKNFPHKSGEFVVRFYGTHDHYWFALGRVFLFQEDDRSDIGDTTNKKDVSFQKAVEEAKTALVVRKQLKLQRDLALRKTEKPPPYIRIRINRPVKNVKPSDLNVSNTNACNCREYMPNPCGANSDCLNRLLLTECDPDVCPAKTKCQNQRFDKRLYPPLMPYKTASRGWGLKSSEPLVKGQFVIEYVGELIDQEEYHRRIGNMNKQKAENYYFLSLDYNRTIDAGPKGNVARFMNHSCKPNCETQKWTVRGDTRVGLFACCDIPANEELTFNYNLATIGDRKEECRCGADNCSGFLGVKIKEPAKIEKNPKKIKKKAKKVAPVKKIVPEEQAVPCFLCGKMEVDIICTMKICGMGYHLKCLELFAKPEAKKWMCPRHYCNVCTKRTIRSCFECLESYCPMHSTGTIKYHKLMGYVCNTHNPDIISDAAAALPSISNLPPTPTKMDVL